MAWPIFSIQSNERLGASIFLSFHEFVISTEGVAVVEKPAGKSERSKYYYFNDTPWSALLMPLPMAAPDQGY